MLKRIDIPCPCDGCERKVVDYWGWYCGTTCDKRILWFAEKTGAKSQYEADLREHKRILANLKEEVNKYITEATKNMVKISPQLAGILVDGLEGEAVYIDEMMEFIARLESIVEVNNVKES